MTGIHLLWFHTEYFHSSKNTVFCLFISLNSLTLATTVFFTVSIVLPFPDGHIIKLIQEVIFIQGSSMSFHGMAATSF